MASALHYLHSLRIIHRDVKPENLLVYRYSDGTKRLKLCDFGLATIKRANEKLDFVCGTATYVSPEMIRATGKIYKKKSKKYFLINLLGYDEGIDVWAMGIIAYILLCGFPPFRSESGEQNELFEDILEGQLEFPSPYWDDVGPDAEDLIIKVLNRDEESRVTAGDVLHHQWLNNPNNNFHQELTPKWVDNRNSNGPLEQRIIPAQSMPSLYEGSNDNEIML